MLLEYSVGYARVINKINSIQKKIIDLMWWLVSFMLVKIGQSGAQQSRRCFSASVLIYYTYKSLESCDNV